MTIEDAQKIKVQFEENFNYLLDNFEKETGLQIDGVSFEQSHYIGSHKMTSPKIKLKVTV